MVSEDAIVCPAGALADTRAVLRIDGGGEDTLLTPLVETATAACEVFTGQVPIARRFVETVPVGGAWTRLSRTPVREIVALRRADGTAVAPDAYAFDIDADGDGWVRLMTAADAGRCAVEFRAGLALDWAGVPAAMRHGIVRLAAHLHAGREGGPPAAVTALWRPYRRMLFGRARAGGGR